MDIQVPSTAKHGQIVLQNENKKISIESDGSFKVDGKTVSEDLELYHAFRKFFGLLSHKESVNNLLKHPEGATK